MKSVLITFAGIVAIFAGIFVMYLFITGLNTTTNFIFLVLSLVAIGGGVYLLIFATGQTEIKNDNTDIKVTQSNSAGIIEKNNNMLKEWKKTNETKDKLKIIQLATSAEADSAKQKMSS